MTKGPLAGVRVADFTWVGAGSYMTKLLAEHGADVIKVESRSRLDGLRRNPPFKDGVPGENRSGYFADRNTNKRGICLNLKSDEGREIAKRLVEVSDIVANNFSPGAMERFGLGYETLADIKPSIIYVAMSMQGDSGPHRDYLGYGLTIGALVGLHHLTGAPSEPPVGTGTNYPDHLPNPCHGAFAVLAALRHRRLTGEGQYIDLSQIESTLQALGPTMLATSAGMEIGAQGDAHERHAPHGVFACGDGASIAIAVRDPSEWEQLRGVLRLHDEPGTALGADGDEGADRALRQAISQWDAEPLFEALQEAGVPAGVVKDAKGVIEDPQLGSRGHWVALEHPEMGRVLQNAAPFRLSGTPSALRRPAPCVGEHTSEVLGEVLGLSGDEINRLAEAGALH